MNNNKMNIVLSSDDKFAPFLGTTLASILINADASDELNFIILDGGISEKNKQGINGLKKFKEFDIEFINLKNLPTTAENKRKAHPAFFRLKIASIKPELDKVLYLDSDLIVKTSLKPLWDEDIENYIIAAVENPGEPAKAMQKQFKTENYFNSGVLLINLKKWRENNIENELISYIDSQSSIIKTGDLPYGDQNILNVVLDKQVKYLHLKWNAIHTTCLEQVAYTRLEEMEEASCNPAIIHFTSSNKPWTGLRHKHKATFYYYLFKTPWALQILLFNITFWVKQLIIRKIKLIKNKI